MAGLPVGEVASKQAGQPWVVFFGKKNLKDVR